MTSTPPLDCSSRRLRSALLWLARPAQVQVPGHSGKATQRTTKREQAANRGQAALRTPDHLTACRLRLRLPCNLYCCTACAYAYAYAYASV